MCDWVGAQCSVFTPQRRTNVSQIDISWEAALIWALQTDGGGAQPSASFRAGKDRFQRLF